LERIGTGRLWIHAVSVGEVGIALKFIREFHLRNPEARFLVSSTTSTGLTIPGTLRLPMAGTDRQPGRLSRDHGTAPPAPATFRDSLRGGGSLAESDRRREKLRIPVLLLNARLSRRSERRFRMLGPLAAWFNQLDLIMLSDEEDRDRFLSLGVRADILRVTGNIKHDSPMVSLPPRDGATIFLAASTHAGEEEEIARAYLSLRDEYPGLRLVIAPRHAERRQEDSRGSDGPWSSMSSPFGRNAGIGRTSAPRYHRRTLPAWYPGATVVFVGKSLPCSVNKGGQNMIEPLQAGAPVLIGPYTGNFEPLATRLCRQAPPSACTITRKSPHHSVPCWIVRKNERP